MPYDDVALMAYVVVRCDDRPSTRSAQAPRRADAPDAPDAVAALARPRAARALRAERHVPVSHALVEPPVEEGPDPVRFPRLVFFVCARCTPRPADLHAAMACTARRHRATPRQRSRYTQAEREAQEGAHHARVGPRGRPRGEHHGRERAARARPGRHARPAEGTHADDRVAVASADGAEEVKFAFVRLSPRRRRGGAVVSADGWTRSRYRDSDRAEVPASGLLGRLLGTPSPSPPQS